MTEIDFTTSPAFSQLPVESRGLLQAAADFVGHESVEAVSDCLVNWEYTADDAKLEAIEAALTFLGWDFNRSAK